MRKKNMIILILYIVNAIVLEVMRNLDFVILILSVIPAVFVEYEAIA